MRLILNHHDGVTTYYRGMVDGKVVVETAQDCQGIVDQNKRDQTSGKSRGDLRKIASIPAVIWNKWMIDDGVNLNKMHREEKNRYLRRKLNDPDWKWLKPIDEVV